MHGTQFQVAAQFISQGSVYAPMGSEISSKSELRSGPDIQRFLEDAAEATAEFARKARITVVIPEPTDLGAEDPLPPGSRVFARLSCCCNAGRQQPAKVEREAKRSRVAPPPRGWKTAAFILGSEFGEKLGSTTITYNLVVYLTTQMHLPLVEALCVSTASFSASSLAPLFGEFLADAYLGRFTAVAAGSVFYLGGLVLFNILVMESKLQPGTCHGESNRDDQCHQATGLQMVVLFLSLTLQTMGSGGVRPCAAPYGADQCHDSSNSAHQSEVQNFFNWYKACMASATIVAVTVVIWVQTNIGWGWGSLVLCVTMGLSLVALLGSSSYHRCFDPTGSPLTSLLRVLVAAIRKRKLRLPDNPEVLYQVNSQGINTDLLHHTKNMRGLDNAAILEDWNDDIYLQECNPWRLCTVHQVEELKKILAMVPVWLCSSASAIVYIQVFTVMTKQALIMDRKVGNLEVPAGSMGVFSILTFLTFVPLYDTYLVRVLRRITSHPKGLTSLQRVGFGMLIGILAMGVSTMLENRRRVVAMSSSGSNQQLSAFWLLPQFVLAGLGESFVVPGLLEFFYDETPTRLRGVHKSFVGAALGMSGLLSTMLVSILQVVTKSQTGASNGWFHDDMNRGRLDYFYCALTVLTILVFAIYLFIASAYVYTIKTDCQTLLPFRDS